MDKKDFLQKSRISTIILGILCLLISGVMILNFFIAGQKIKNDEIIYPDEMEHRVLFLSSYDPLYYTYEAQRQGLEKVFYPQGFEYDVIFMNSRKWRNEQDRISYRDFLKSRLTSHHDYEAIIVGDDAALEFALEYQAELFPTLPVVFFGINDLALAERAAKNPMMTGFYEDSYFRQALDTATKLFPNRKKIVALHDSSYSGKSDVDAFFRQKSRFPNHIFIDLDSSSMTRAEFVATLEALDDETILFYMNCYRDKDGIEYSILSTTNTVVKHTHIPVFRNYMGAEGQGIVGSVYMDMEEHCALAAQLAIDCVYGVDPQDVPLEMKTPSKCVFDYALIKKYGLDFSVLPENTIFINKPETFLVRYGQFLCTMVFMAAALILFLVSSQLSAEVMRISNTELVLSRDSLEKSQDELLYQTEHDEVLDIYNRRTVLELLANQFTEKDTYSVVVIDIDNFKELNETYGHQVCDSVLQYLVAEFKQMEKQFGWLLARFGGDEFLIVIRGENLGVNDSTTKKIFDIVRTPIPLGDESIGVTASLGISNSDGVTFPVQHVINAEIAMYEAKERGKNGAFIYGDEMKERMRQEMRIKEKLMEAFDNDGFYMLYQPQIDAKSKKVSGYEALVRMKTPGIFPGQFIPVAERSGWIWRIGRITTELVIKQLAEWKAQGHELHPVSVNFSSNQLNDYGYINFVEELLKKYDVPPNLLEIEITEGLFLEKSVLADQIFKHFKERGIRLLMDDFGTGYSSLGYLTYIPVDVIKLDKSLVDTYLVDGKDSFIRNIINLMHDLDKEMIIEGVEEQWQFQRLREFGADTIQGYYFSKPIPPDEAIVFDASEK